MFGFVFGPFWDHFGVILGWGPPPPPPPSEKGINFGTPFCTVLGSLLGPLWDPLGDPWASQGAKKKPKGSPKRGLERGPKPDPKKDPILDPPWRGSGELSLKREHSFHYFEGVAFGTHFGTILGPIWDPRGVLKRDRATCVPMPKVDLRR